MSTSFKVIKTDLAPAAIGPYSQALQAGPFLFCSGQIGFDPQTMKFAGLDVVAQTKCVLTNVQALLKAGGATVAQVVKTTIFLTDLKDFEVVNTAYGEVFGQGSPPARSTVQVAALPRGALVEIEVLAYLGHP